MKEEYSWEMENISKELYDLLTTKYMMKHEESLNINQLEESLKEGLIDIEIENYDKNDYSITLNYSINPIIVEQICKEFVTFLKDDIGYFNKSFDVNKLVDMFVDYKQGEY